MPSALVLTPKGAVKIQAAVRAAVQGAQLAIAREALETRALVASFAPSPEAEAQILSRGTAHGGDSSGAVVGTSEGGRFLRQGQFVSIREAIASDPVRQFTQGPYKVFATIGHAERINARTGFFWMTRRRGMQGPTFPFNRALLQAFEYGGAAWVVTPRSGTRSLEPEDGVFTQVMTKTIPPHQMYWRAGNERSQIIKQRIWSSVRSSVRQVGIG